jgi:hypothetical protein
MSSFPSIPQVPLVDAKGNMHIQWQGYFTALNRALNALGGVPPTPTSPSVLATAYKGNWSGTTTYYPGDEVSNSGNLYRALQESLNVTPANGTYWLLIGPLTLDWIANGGTYAKVLSTGLTSGVVNTAGLVSSAATDIAYASTTNFTVGIRTNYAEAFSLTIGPYPQDTNLVFDFIGSVTGDSTNADAFLAYIGNSAGGTIVLPTVETGPIPVSSAFLVTFEWLVDLPANTTTTYVFWVASSSSTITNMVLNSASFKAEAIKR